MRRSRLIHTVLVLAVLAVPRVAHATGPGLGIFADTGGADCNLTIDLGVPVLIHVLYLGHGGPEATGVEYRIVGFPGTLNISYLAELIEAPGSNLNLGNAFDGVGHNVAWPTPQPFDANGNVLVASYRIVVVNPSLQLADVVLRVERRSSSNCDLFACCPLITDANFNPICLAPGEAHVNSPGSCTVAVEPTTWTSVRNLYR